MFYNNYNKFNFVTLVLGEISPEELGRTLTHEHTYFDAPWAFVPPPTKAIEKLINEKLTLSNVGLLKQYPYGRAENFHMMGDEVKEAVLYDLKLYKEWGGGSIVENTSHGLHGSLEFSRNISRETNVHVIHGTGHYRQIVQTENTLQMSVEQLTNLYTNDILVGVEFDSFPGDPIKCGAIGEVGSDWPLSGK